ncbi:FAD-dependent monooxygenase [Streptomyces chengbuensis]|uniref:FAD-dependent monooxygenase n=1 Tax=Streptomyces chengbuensis TaxID=3053466 RepID=UPI0025B5270B|nr:FAD-dependent monooxygenase [Streptomyces sp. HUAS CB01]WJY54487.1 FAD-dependent monooxygenase [Streptomyces sp. HUAS CB01]
MKAASRTPVVIIGAGPVGVTAALLLARYGVRSLLLERHPDVYPLPRAVVVDDEVRRILQSVGVHVPLFVVPAPGVTLDDVLREKIRNAIRTGASPRHVPDEILAVAAIPHTRTGKKREVPVKRLLQGAPAEQVLNPSAVDNPDLVAYFAGLGCRGVPEARRG